MADPLQDLANLQTQLVDSEHKAEQLKTAMAAVGEQIRQSTSPTEIAAMLKALGQLNAQFKSLESVNLGILIAQQQALTRAMTEAAKAGKPLDGLAQSHAALNAPIAAAGGNKGPSLASQAAGGAVAGAQAMAGVAGAAMSAAKSLLALPQTIASLAGPFAQVVSQFSPATVTQFNQALQDLSAALGSIVEPVVDAFRDVADLINSVVTQIAPVLRPVVAEIAGVLKDLVSTVLADLQPAISVAAAAFAQVVSGLRPILDALLPVFAQLSPMVADMVANAFRPLQTVMAILVPVIQGLAPLFATLGAMANEFGNMLKDLFSGLDLKPILDSLGDGLRNFLLTVRDGVAVLGASFATIKHIIDNWNVAGAWTPARLQEVFGEAVNRFRNAGGEEVRRPQGGHTFAAGNATNIDTAAIGQQARLAALSVRSETTLNTQATERNTDAIERFIDQVRTNPNLPEWMRGVAEGLQPSTDVGFGSTGTGGSW